MPSTDGPVHDQTTAAEGSRRLFLYAAGLWRGPRLRRILMLAGWRPTLGLPRDGDAVGVWGASPYAWRGQAVAARRGVPLVRIEDAFLRSVLPGRARGARGPLGLLIDPYGIHFDPTRESLIERLAQSPLAAAAQERAVSALARLRAAGLSKYNAHRPDAPLPAAPGYVLVVDQTRGDAALMGAGRAVFLRMLEAARDENPGVPIVIRSHPETARGLRPGHFTPADLRDGDVFDDSDISPWHLVENASRTYAVSSQLGYEAMLTGQRPRLFGQPCYAGWGLSDDEAPVPRRQPISLAQLFAATHLLAPVWYDPCRDALTDFDGALNQLEAETRAFQQDRDGHLAYGMRLWKRPALARFFGQGKGVRFTRQPQAGVTLAWANAPHIPASAARVEDGFLRSKGLGAALTPPLSLVTDRRGIYYDPTRESDLERLIAAPLPPGGEARALSLVQALRAARLTKYNLQGAATLPDTGGRRVILVPGQVQDDASIRLGAGAERSNAALLARVRVENPDAFLIYKPHPDVEAGLRPGAISATEADWIAHDADPLTLIEAANEVWTITSTLGFEALLRGTPVTTLGAPFYAGWGLTRDLGPIPERRRARVGLPALAHAALIAYPRYHDPVSNLPCPPETAIWRLTRGDAPRPPALRLLAKAQGALASYAHLWRQGCISHPKRPSD
ncbi:MAG: capsular polysaccharide biosynthesis protein [Paracoccus sp. (in: a-proteobacteria)]|uniref:capsular polysaccharide biosynthesis protein n=1 Tax=Paracoccus sp. TaxID=267 RepID=UPI0026DEC325|nr:capsular polysaccharide biosynthesis protein [Paracoccus sp. (in: a-proteobacteria)]MDO5621367.1 capsular polysaccharide biosynthesis protein [Paracoccus sp. (in: a-proteobacteria)]